MYLKIMGPEDCPDNDSRKTFTLISNVECVTFERPEGKVPIVYAKFDDGEDVSFPVPHNAYLMNNDGVTVSSFGSAVYRRAA